MIRHGSRVPDRHQPILYPPSARLGARPFGRTRKRKARRRPSRSYRACYSAIQCIDRSSGSVNRRPFWARGEVDNRQLCVHRRLVQSCSRMPVGWSMIWRIAFQWRPDRDIGRRRHRCRNDDKGFIRRSQLRVDRWHSPGQTQATTFLPDSARQAQRARVNFVGFAGTRRPRAVPTAHRYHPDDLADVFAVPSGRQSRMSRRCHHHSVSGVSPAFGRNWSDIGSTISRNIGLVGPRRGAASTADRGTANRFAPLLATGKLAFRVRRTVPSPCVFWQHSARTGGCIGD